MSLTKAEVPVSAYLRTGEKRVTDSRSAMLKVAERLSTLSLMWLLVKRHKVALLAVGNIILLLNWALPAWPEMIRSLF